MKVLVTGSSGLIGREVSRLLLEKKIEVIEFSTSNGKDISNPLQLQESMRGCAAVIHLAAIIDESQSKEKIWKTNVDGTQHVLDAAVQERVQRILFTSSVGVYGETNGTKTEETPLNPQTPYEQSKAEAEKRVIANQELVPFTIVRPALVVGPNKYWKQIFKIVQKNFPLIGNGQNKWQTVYYKDVANAIVFLLLLDAAENETFIVAGNEKPTLKELLQTIRSQLGLANPGPTVPLWFGKILARFLGVILALQGKPNILSPRNIERMLHERDYDLTKIHAYGWKAKFSYQQSLKETLAEFEQKS